MTKEMEAQVRVIVKAEAKRIVDENTQLKILLARLLAELPVRRDWLDPDLEREAKELLKRYASAQS